MKKFLAILCVLVLICSLIPFSAFAGEKTVPVIIFMGYSGPSLINTDTGEKVWGLDFDAVGDKIKAKLPDIAGTAGSTFTGDYTELVDILGSVFLDVMEPVACNPDGSSKYNLTYTPKGAENTRVSVLKERGQENYIAEPDLVEALAAEIGYENIFIFTYDWRLGQVDYANAINDYVKQVKEITGSSQVDLFGLSHGGQCIASYLYYYGDNGDVRKACMSAPAIGGTSMAGDPMTGQPVNLDYAKIIEFAEIGYSSEDEWEWLIKFIGYEHLNEVVTLLCQKYIVDYIKYYCSIWDFVPLAVFEDAIAYTGINEQDNGDLYLKTRQYHEEAMTHMSEGLKRAKDAGVKIAIMTNYGSENVTGSNKNSDYIIDTTTSSGAYCAPFDEKLPDDYVCSGKNCSDETHYHISPERTVDASCAYLPDNTWLISGQLHGMYVYDENTRGFIMEFLLGNSITDVYSNRQYPQFMKSQNPADGLYIQFDNTSSGFHSSNDTKLILKNVSRKYDIKVRNIFVRGSEVKILPDTNTKIAAGKQAEIDITPYTIKNDKKPFTITVVYTLYNDQNLLQIKDFEFTSLTPEQESKYSYLITPVTVSPEVIDLNKKPDVTTTKKATTETTTAATTQSQQGTSNTQVNSPKTGTSKLKLTGLIAFCIASVSVTGVIVKKKHDEDN